METALFWVAWLVISSWALKTFYFTFDKDKLRKLRLTALGIDLSVLVLFFLPWLPLSFGGQTGWELISQGNTLVILLGMLVAGSAACFIVDTRPLLKVGAVLSAIASVLFILTMVNLMPGTFALTLQSVAPVLASLMLLVGNVVVLLLWQQIELIPRKKIRTSRGFAPIWIILMIFLMGGLFAIKQGYLKFPSQPKTSSTTVPKVAKLSLRDVCLDKIKDVPAPPFSYKSKRTSGTLLPLHDRKVRFPNEDKTSSCITDYSVLAVKEQAFKDMGFDYYVPNKTTGKQLNYPAFNGQFNKAVDRAYTELMKVKNWKRVTPEDEREGGLPYIVYYKEEGVYKMYADITQGTDMFFFVTLTVIGP